MKALNIVIGAVFVTILVVVWVMSERANPVMLDEAGNVIGEQPLTP